jgi:energy-coupling factor transporter ATP-binding protein EcfA2
MSNLPNIFNTDTIDYTGDIAFSRIFVSLYPGMEFVEDARPDYYVLRSDFEKMLQDIYGTTGRVLYKAYLSAKCVEIRLIEEAKTMICSTFLIDEEIVDRNYRLSSKDLDLVHEMNDLSSLQEKLDRISAEEYNARALAPLVTDEELKHVSIRVFFYPLSETEKAKQLCESYNLLRFDREDKKATNDNSIFTLGQGANGLYLNKHYLDTTKYKGDIITSNYNDSFSEAYTRLVSFLKSDENGLVLLTGEPGTGKSSLLMHLTSVCKDLKTRFIFIPAVFAGILSDPGFLPFAIANLNNSVIILEDAEDVLRDRAAGGGSAISNILNVTDGILGKLVKVKLIATVNKAHVIDFAILRKGRLKLQYEFDKLTVEKANKLFEKLGKDRVTDTPLTLADIYNDLAPTVGTVTTTPKRKIGF